MKKIYFLLMLTIVTNIVWSQTTRRWVGPNNGSFTEANNWRTGLTGGVQGAPQTNDILYFNEGNVRTIINVSTITLNGLIVQNNTRINLQNANFNQTISIRNGAQALDLSVEIGSTLALLDGSEGDGVNIVLQNNQSAVASIAGTLIIENGRTFDTDNNNVTTNVSGVIENRSTINSDDVHMHFLAGSRYIHNQNGGSIPRADWNNTSICEVTGVSNERPLALDQEFGHFTWNCPNQSSEESFAGSLTNIDGNFTVISTGTGSIVMKISGGTTTTTNIDGNYIQSGGTVTILRDNNGYNFNVLGDFNMSGGTLKRSGFSTVNFGFAGNGVQTFTKTGGTISGDLNFTINNGATVDFGTSILTGSTGTFTLSSGGKIITANPNGLGNSGTIQMLRSFNSGADYEFHGPVTGSFTTTNDPQVRNMTIDNATGVTLSKAMTVNGVLTLASGYLTTTTNLLTINTNGSVLPSSTAFVNGPLAKVFGGANVTFNFPVGTVSGGVRTIGATTVTTPAAGSTTFTARFFDANPKTSYLNAVIDPAIKKISTCEYWTLDRSTGGGTKYQARVTLTWNAASNCGNGAYVTDRTKLVVSRHNGGTPGTWTNAGYSASTANSVTSLTLNNFSPFTIGTTDAEANPLPVVFGDVKAYEKSSGVQIEWSNLTEKDVALYTIERSSNGRDFSAIGTQLPTSNQDDKASYIGYDAAPNSGANYYRIKAAETTGKIVYSKILTVNPGKSEAGMRLYPNPVTGNQVTLSLSGIKHGAYNVRVVNASGQDIFRKAISAQGSGLTQTLDLPTTVKPGVYNIIVTGDNYRATKTFIVQ